MRYETEYTKFLCEDASLLIYDAVSTGKYILMFQRSFQPPSPVEVDSLYPKYWGSKLLQNAGNCLRWEQYHITENSSIHQQQCKNHKSYNFL